MTSKQSPSSSKYFDRRFERGLLHPKHWPTWLAIGLMGVFAFTPVRLRDAIASVLARVVFRLAKKPINVARANLGCCFPDKSSQQVELLLKENVRSFVMVLLGQAELLVRSTAYIRRRVALHGFEHVEAAKAQGQAIIFIMPHVWGIDYAGLRLNLDLSPMVTMAKAHRNPLFNWFNNRMRSRFGGNVYMREAGIRALLGELKQGNSFFYLPDEDLGPKNSVFAPFFATTKATLPVVGRLASVGNAQVLPIKIGYDTQAHQFNLTVMPAILPESMAGKEQEALALNQAVEAVISAFPEQYMWFLKILKTRPEGQASIYQ
ncbi:lauroyl-Kdo(2)-lipid IV(A) myristoyltransferase [Shewanella sp. NIFS-20-20]|uniref:lauroyl-Kdo(2)-lipid IV(A) myristoyltransferase n=1 Tax=Shewanella sp. NIFS-20-20 TaxID=2853806 RepID=UPI001C484188|nr:lauroyl-Kdo(2)-lipid IV(A) myristoyltransferase [Shewanella sp. NIFS-20-20]MBV7314388.1 lauroyl-Kdo(2)-lipid IV(A) myristoyltransferase [Shewanella sp. NIFS-20-20]